MTEYLAACRLFVACLEVAYVSDREGLRDRLLRVPVDRKRARNNGEQEVRAEESFGEEADPEAGSGEEASLEQGWEEEVSRVHSVHTHLGTLLL
jgi:hypothetical protein